MRKISPTQAVRRLDKIQEQGRYVHRIWSLASSLDSIRHGCWGNWRIIFLNTFIQTTIIAIIAGIGSGLLNVGFAHFARKDEAAKTWNLKFPRRIPHQREIRCSRDGSHNIAFTTIVAVNAARVNGFSATEEQSQDFELMMMALKI